MFRPKLLDTLRGYTRQQFTRDLLAGIIVGIVALPLAIAFAIASGVSPEKGLVTAVIGGFLISALGGSRVQIGGPTGAFIVIVYGIVQVHGINGLIIATFMGGVLLVLMGLARFGSVIKYIPYPLIVGFTSGIALVIFSSQVKDFFGLEMGSVPADFIEKWGAYFSSFNTASLEAPLIGVATLLIIFLWPRVTHKIPGSLVAILVTTAAVHLLGLQLETIGSRFGAISSALPAPRLPVFQWETIKELIQPAVTIAILGGIESLLSAVVADGMIRGNHKSNAELIGQGVANISSSIFGGIPATGAIARTVTNIKSGGRTPVAGIVHAFTLLLILLFFGKWAALIPMATLSGILVVVAYNMSEWRNFRSVLKGPKSDVAVLMATFLLTVLVDLTIAIEIGMVLAAFLFMRKMIQFTSVNVGAGFYLEGGEGSEEGDKDKLGAYNLPPDCEVFEISGPLFFGAAYKFKDAIRLIEKPPKVFILRMGRVPIIDATGIRTLKEVYQESFAAGTRLILSEANSEQVLEELRKSRLLFAIGKANVTPTFRAALQRAEAVLAGA